eukprot:gene4491-35139_t
MLKALGSSAARSTRTAGWAVSGSGGCARTSISGAGASAGGGVGAGGRQLKCWRMRTGARAAAAAAGPSWGGQRQYLSSERFKIYTKTGDAGTTALFTGERRPKDDAEFEVLGATDELSSFIGLARAQLDSADSGSIDLGEQLEDIQCTLQELGSHVATPRSKGTHEKRLARTEFSAERTDALEAWIDSMDESLPPLTNFILPSGGVAGATLHCCRSICRRAERAIVPLNRAGQIDPAAYKYLNRLSDYLFTAARFAAQQAGSEETIYRPTR